MIENATISNAVSLHGEEAQRAVSNHAPAAPTPARIIAEARAWLGTPYRHQASLIHVGADCLGLVRGVWRAVYGGEPEAVPAYTGDWVEATGAETLAETAARHMAPVPLDGVQPGDLILFRWRAGLPAKHAAILIAPDRFIHAHDGAAVAEAALSPWWRRRVAYAFRFPNVTGQDAE